MIGSSSIEARRIYVVSGWACHVDGTLAGGALCGKSIDDARRHLDRGGERSSSPAPFDQGGLGRRLS